MPPTRITHRVPFAETILSSKSKAIYIGRGVFQLPEAHKQAAFPGFNGTAVGIAAHWTLYPSRFSAEMTLTVTSKTLVIFLIALLPFPFLEHTQFSPLKRHPFFEDSSSGLLRI